MKQRSSRQPPNSIRKPEEQEETFLPFLYYWDAQLINPGDIRPSQRFPYSIYGEMSLEGKNNLIHHHVNIFKYFLVFYMTIIFRNISEMKDNIPTKYYKAP